MMVFSTGSATVGQTVAAAPGRVLAATPDAIQAITSDGANAFLTVFTNNAPTVSQIGIPGVIAAAFTTDAQRYYLLTADAIYTIYRGSVVTRTNLNSTANDLALSTTNNFVYIAGGSAAGVGRRPVCQTNSTPPADISTVAPPKLIAALATGEILGADANGFSEITTVESNAVGTTCPPSGSSTVDRANFASSLTPRKIIPAYDGSRAALTNSTGNVLVFNNSSNTVTPIALNGATESFSGGFAPGNTNLYIGAGDSKVHRLDVAAGTDAQQITVSFVPDLVAVKP
jgi:hypothetical protein